MVETWFKCVSLEDWSIERREVTLCAPNQFVANWVGRNYSEVLRSGLSRLLNTQDLKIIFKQTSSEHGGNTPVSLVSEQELNAKPVEQKSKTTVQDKIWPAKAQKTQASHQAAMIISMDKKRTDKENPLSKKDLTAKQIGICSKYRFDTFVVGPHNHLAYSASLAISRGALKGYNPLFIYGKTGLGKTHLLNCIGNEARELRPNAKIEYKTSDKFVDEFIGSIRFDRIHQFKEKYCSTDLLLIDDIQFLSQKEQTQEVFFHIFNRMHQQNKQIVLSSDMPPSQITGLQARLKSRFGWGLIADVQPPELETRVAILMKKADSMKINLPHSSAEKIATKVNTNIRELEGILTRISTVSILRGIPISERLIEQELAGHQTSTDKTAVCPNELIKTVARIYEVSTVEIKSKKRDKTVSTARQLSMYLLREYTNFSLKAIGDFVGGRSHATVLHAVENIQSKIASDEAFSHKVNSITDNLPQNECD